MPDVQVRHGGRQRHDYKLREKFGIGIRQYEAMYEQQNGACYICHKEDPAARNLAVDHCHTTGKVRRLLCHHCNTALGHFNDDPTLLQRAIEYIQTDFELPPDVPEPYPERRSKRSIVKTPDGVFQSFRHAGEHYGVDETTIANWCGRRKTHLKKEGFSYMSTSIKISEINEDLFA